MSEKDGGPAFPAIESEQGANGQFYQFSVGGMSQRDYYAGQALAGLATCRPAPLPGNAFDPSNIAKLCYLYAG